MEELNIQDFRDFIVKEKVTEEDIDQWMLQHPENTRFQEAATKIKNEWLEIQQSLKNKEALQQALKEAKEKQDEIDRIEDIPLLLNYFSKKIFKVLSSKFIFLYFLKYLKKIINSIIAVTRKSAAINKNIYQRVIDVLGITYN